MKRLMVVSVFLVSCLFASGIRKGVEYSPVELNRPEVHDVLLESFDTEVIENWDEVTEIPAAWRLIDGDGDSNSWFIYDANPHSAPHCVGSEYISSTVANDDWLITPQVTISGHYALDFWYASQDPAWPDDIDVYISTTGNDPEDFTDTVLVERSVPAIWQRALIDLIDYDGQDIYVAFHNVSLDDYVLKIDDISIKPLPSHDVIASGYSGLVPLSEVEYTPTLNLLNFSSAEETFTVICEITNEGEIVYSEEVEFTFSPVENREVSLPVFDIGEDMAYDVSIIVTVDGDEDLSNNALDFNITNYVSEPRKVLIQKFTSTGCQFCPYAAEGLRIFSEGFDEVPPIIAYHSTTSFGPDPYYSDDFVPLDNEFNVGGYPDVYVAGMEHVSGGYPASAEYGAGVYLDMYNDAGETYVPYSVEIMISDITDESFSITTVADQLYQVSSVTEPILRYAIMERFIDYRWGSDRTMYLDELDFVARDLVVPDGIILEKEIGQIIDENEVMIDPEWNLDNIYIIAYVQDQFNNEVFTCDIQFLEITGVTEKNIENPDKYSLFCSPNPFNASLEINYVLESNESYSLDIYDLKGSHIKSLDRQNATKGNNTVVWNGVDDSGKSVPSGVYIVHLNQGNFADRQLISLVK